MDIKSLFDQYKTYIILGSSVLIIGLSANYYLSDISDRSDQYKADKVLSSSIKFEEKVNFGDVYNKHSYDKDTTDNASKKIKESFFEAERKKREAEEKAEARKAFVLDSIKKSNDDLAAKLAKRNTRKSYRRTQKRTPKKALAVTPKVVKEVKSNVDDNGFLTESDFDDDSSLESTLTNDLSASASTSDDLSIYWAEFAITKAQTVKNGTIVMFENQEDLQVGNILIPAFSKLQTKVSLSSGRCKFKLQKILTNKKVYKVSGDLYDQNRTPGVSTKIQTDNNSLVRGVTSLGNSALAVSDQTGLLNDAVKMEVDPSSDKYAELRQNLEVLVNLTISKKR